MAKALAVLHDSRTVADVVSAGINLNSPRPQATPAELRDRFLPLLSRPLIWRIQELIDWVESMLSTSPAGRTGDDVLLHGNWHSHNLIFSYGYQQLMGVLDFEEASIGDRHYDFRYLPSMASTFALLNELIFYYERLANVTLNFDRILAWHVLTDLGDALWNTEAQRDVAVGPANLRAQELLFRLGGSF